MRYYEYLSSAKVDMLFSQIDVRPQPAGREFSLDFKIVKVGRKVDGINQPTLFGKLDALEEWIYANRSVGSIDDPDDWIYGRIMLRVAHVDPSREAAVGQQLRLREERKLEPRVPYERAAVIFLGHSEQSVIAMVGSARHLLLTGHGAGEPMPAAGWSSVSGTRDVIHTYAEYFDIKMPAHLARDDEENWSAMRGVQTINEAFVHMDQYARSHPDHLKLFGCEFLALRIASAENEGDTVRSPPHSLSVARSDVAVFAAEKLPPSTRPSPDQ